MRLATCVRGAAMEIGIVVDEQLVPWEGQHIAVSVRLGLAHYGQQDSADDLLERAEAELEERANRIAHLRHPAE